MAYFLSAFIIFFTIRGAVRIHLQHFSPILYVYNKYLYNNNLFFYNAYASILFYYLIYRVTNTNQNVGGIYFTVYTQVVRPN